MLLGHEMGLGKTPMAIAIAAHCIAADAGGGAGCKVLVVAPPVLLEQWRSEVLRWWPEAMAIPDSAIQVIRKGTDEPLPDATVVIVSYSIIAGTKAHPNLHLRATATGRPYKVIVVDEAHALKSTDSNRTLALVPMLRDAAHVVLMTGTPLANACAADIYPLLDGLCGGAEPIQLPPLKDWNARYCREKRRVWLPAQRGRPIERWVGVSEEHGAELHALLGELMVRQRKEDVLHELPAKRRSCVVLQLKPSELKRVGRQMAAVRDLGAALHGGSGGGGSGGGGSGGGGSGGEEHGGDENEGTEPSRCVAGAAHNTGGVDDDDDCGGGGDGVCLPSAEVQSIFRSVAEAKAGAVVEWLETSLLEGWDTSSGRKVLIFAHHHVVHDAIAAFLSRALRADEWVHITGRSAPSDRSERLAAFKAQPQCRIALLALASCGVGLNLTCADCAVFAELCWNPATLEQAEARIHRIGQQASHVNVYYLLGGDTADSIDRVMFGAHQISRPRGAALPTDLPLRRAMLSGTSVCHAASCLHSLCRPSAFSGMPAMRPLRYRSAS